MGKKIYASPKLQVEQFSTSHSVAAGCQSQVIDEGYIYVPCTIKCVVTNEDVIFTSKTGHGTDPDTGLDWGTETCAHVVTPGQDGSDFYFTEYEGKQYFIWHGPAGAGATQAGRQALLRILNTVGITSDSYGHNQFWHAGPTSECKEEFWHLLGFSY